MSTSNPVMADCPPMKGAETMIRQSGKITALYCRLSDVYKRQDRGRA